MKHTLIHQEHFNKYQGTKTEEIVETLLSLIHLDHVSPKDVASILAFLSDNIDKIGPEDLSYILSWLADHAMNAHIASTCKNHNKRTGRPIYTCYGRGDYSCPLCGCYYTANSSREAMENVGGEGEWIHP